MALDNFGIKPYGFVRPSLNDIINEYNTTARETIGMDINLTDSSRIGTFLKIFAYQDSQLWGLLEGVYNSRTLSGAEGKYLDDILSRRGIFRRNALPGTGEVVVQVDRFATWLGTIPLNTQFTSNTGKNYTPQGVTQFRDKIFAYKVSRLNAVNLSPSITFTIRNYTTGQFVSQLLTTSSTSFSADLVNFIQTNMNPAETNKVFVDIASDTVYVGFNVGSLTTPAGLEDYLFFYADVNVGFKWSVFEVICTEVGVNPVQVGGITQMNPAVTGLVNVNNYKEFNSGSEIETDTEYRIRASTLGDEALASTKPAVIKAVSDLNGVNSVRIYDNPNSVDEPEALAFTFNTVVYGGNSTEIINTIAEKKPINAKTSGSQSSVYTYTDTSTEIIRYTTAQVRQVNVRVTYSTVDTLPLSSGEVQTIKSNINNLSSAYTIGGTVSVLQLQAAILSSVETGKFFSLAVEVKYLEDLDATYSSNNITVDYDEIPVVLAENIIFNQTV